MTTAQDRGVFDVAVIGAGPAGSATARRLALAGRRVALLERTRYETPRVGESLAPNAQDGLRDLGLWAEFVALAPLPSWGTRSLWGDATPQAHSHLMHPYGRGWHVDRRAFDQMLAAAAATAGATVLDGVALRRSTYRDGCWQLLAASTSAPPGEGGTHALRAHVLIDATGRRAQVARALGAQRMRFDRLIGVAVRFAGVEDPECGYLLVEATPDGWWYSAPLPSGPPGPTGTMIAMLMTDADLCGRPRLSVTDFRQAIARAAHATQRRLGAAAPVSTPRVHCARSQRLLRNVASDAGPWLAVGDATLAVDPVSGSGVLRALARIVQQAA